MSSQKTEYYELNQWLATDQVLRTDFNADNAKIDAALDTHAADIAALETTLSQKGNCQLWTATYTGTGESGEDHPNHLTFPVVPLAVFIIADYGDTLVMISGSTKGLYITHGENSSLAHTTWSGKTVSWYNDGFPYTQMNQANTLYRVLAFYQAD